MPKLSAQEKMAETARLEDAVPLEIVEAPAEPGDPGYDWSTHYGDADTYIHTFPNGKVVALKSFASIYNKTWLYKIRNARTDSEIEFAAIERGSCPEARAVLEDLDDTDGDPINDLWKAWVKAGTSRGDGDEGLEPGN